MQEKTTIFIPLLYLIFLFKSALINHQRNAFLSIRVDLVRLDLVRVKGCAV